MCQVLRDTIKRHKRIIFNGDGYSDDWHQEAARRGLPNLKDSTEAIPKLNEEKSLELFERYKVLSRPELKSRVNAYLEKYTMQLHIESETMVLIGRQMILPAAIRHQKHMAAAVQTTAGAGVDCQDQKAALQEWVDIVFRFNATLTSLAEVDMRA